MNFWIAGILAAIIFAAYLLGVNSGRHTNSWNMPVLAVLIAAAVAVACAWRNPK